MAAPSKAAASSMEEDDLRCFWVGGGGGELGEDEFMELLIMGVICWGGWGH